MQALTDARSWLRPRNARFWIALLLILYTLAGFFLLPWLLQRELPGFVQNLLQREATVARIRFNPWTLALEAEGFDLRETDGSALLGFDKLRLNLQVSSLFRWALVLREVRLTGPSIHLIREGSAEVNLGRLAAAARGPDDPAADPSDGGGLLRLVIHELEITEGVVDVIDRVPATAFQTRLEPINIAVQNLSTLPDDQGDQVVRVQTEGDGVIAWDGLVQLNPLRSEGRISVRVPGLPLATRYLDDVLDFELDGGLLDTAFDYQVQALPDGSFSAGVDDLDLNVTATKLATEDDSEPIFAFQSLRVSGGTLRWPDGAARIDEIVLTEPMLETWLEEDGALNLARLLEEREAPPASTPGDSTSTGQTPGVETAAAPAERLAPAQPETAAGAASTAFELSVGRIAVDALTTRFEDRTLAAPGRVGIAGLDLEVRDVTTAPDVRSPFEVSMRLASGGAISASGEVGLLPAVVASADVRIEEVALAAAQPWIAPFVSAGLDAGTLSGSTTVASSPEESLSLRGQLTIDGLAVSAAEGEDLLRWQQLAVTDLIFLLSARELEIARLTLREPFARIEIDADRQLNLARAMVEQPQAEDAGSSGDGKPLVFRMGSSFIENGSVDFADRSLPLPFSTTVREFAGSISALASDTRQASELDFSGRVGEFGEAEVTGQLIALDPLASSNVRVAFRNVNMPDLSPYSVDFAGRKIAAGKLNLDLDYRFDAAQILGNNRIVLDRIRLGDSVDSPNALDLPLGLAIALLSDSNGVIDVQLTIEGNANDPEFSTRGVISKALANLLIKAVSSPFKLLASLVGGGEEADLKNIHFEAGQATLGPAQEEKLTQLGAALAQRPRLRLTVPGAYAAAVDTTGIATARVRAAANAELESTDGSDELLAERARAVYEKLARDRLPLLDLDELRARFAVEDDDPSTPELDTLAYLTALRDELIAAEPVNEEELQALGNARAATVAAYLDSKAGLPRERLTISDAAAVEPGKENQIAIQLRLDARQRPGDSATQG